MAIGTGRRRSMDERERAIIAAHEVGHAICGRVHGDRRRVEEISLFAHGEALGVTVSSQEDNDLPSESDLRARLIALMGGRAAEELLFHDVTGGASNDFEKATQIATTMVTRFGMGRDPEAVDYGTSGRGVLSLLVPRTGSNLPSEVQPAATRAIRAILDQAYVDACETLAEHLDTLRRIAAFLVEEERVDGEMFEELFEGRVDVATAAGEWRPATARPREWSDVIPFRDRRFRRETPAGTPADRPRGARRRAPGRVRARSSRCPSPPRPPRPSRAGRARSPSGRRPARPPTATTAEGDDPAVRDEGAGSVATSGTPVARAGLPHVASRVREGTRLRPEGTPADAPTRSSPDPLPADPARDSRRRGAEGEGERRRPEGNVRLGEGEAAAAALMRAPRAVACGPAASGRDVTAASPGA